MRIEEGDREEEEDNRVRERTKLWTKRWRRGMRRS